MAYIPLDEAQRRKRAAERNARRKKPGGVPQPPDLVVTGTTISRDWTRPIGPGENSNPVYLQPGKLHLAVGYAERAIADCEVYQRGGRLVRVARLPNVSRTGGIEKPPHSLVICEVTQPFLRTELTANALWRRYDKRSEEWVACDCPKEVVESLHHSVGRWPNVAALLGIVEAPTLLPNGRVTDKEGFYPSAGLYYDAEGIEVPPIPSNPTRGQALTALDTLLSILTGFPFTNAASRSAMISEILTVLTRRTLRSAPLFGHSAPVMGSGKTLLANIGSYIATGRPAYVFSHTAKPEEEAKRILAIFLENPAVAVIDNVSQTLRSDIMCTALTEPVYTDRLLGVSQNVSPPTNVTFVATGNNLTFGGDLTPRALMVSIDPACERPEERTFATNLHVEVPRRRGELAAAALTIIRHHLTAPDAGPKLPSFGRFEAWENWCRLPLVRLGLDDPCLTRGGIEATDPVREHLMALLATWHDVYGDVRKTVAKVIKEMSVDTPLGQAMHAIAGDREGINARRLGRFLQRHEHRVQGGLRFERGLLQDGVLSWFVSTPSGLSGSSGFPSVNTREVAEADTSLEPTGKDPLEPLNPLPEDPTCDPAELWHRGEINDE